MEDDTSQTESSARIHALSAINQDIPRLLNAAGTAISLLTNAPSSSSNGTGDEGGIADLDNRKEAFLKYAREYYTLLQSVRERLEAETKALEDAELIPRERVRHADEKEITNGGLGNFDPAWLNARCRDVGAQKEAELLTEARSMLEALSKKNEGENSDELMKDSTG